MQSLKFDFGFVRRSALIGVLELGGGAEGPFKIPLALLNFELASHQRLESRWSS